jgi:hypothetical protein
MKIFFCAGMSFEMAESKINVEDPRLDSSTDGDDDGPDARQRRRERREAKKILVADESVLDESDEESEASHMEQEESAAPPAQPGDGARATPAPQETATAAAAVDAAALAPEPRPAASSRAVGADPASSYVPDSGISIGNMNFDKNKALLSKKPIETIMLNINAEANQSGADAQLSPNPANRIGAGGGGGAKP